MKRILFVDDEQYVLDGLRNLLRKQRGQWEMVFAHGSDAAMAELAKAAFDVVVTDIRMPGLDGVALLEHVRDRYPGTARIVLSGHAEGDKVVSAIPVAHQFLSKPCDADTLRGVVERAFGLQALMRDEPIRAAVGRLEKLPSVPDVYWELNRLLSHGDAGIGDVAAVVEKDPAMGAKLLQLVNSAYFGLPARMSAIKDAVCYIGLDLMQGLVLTAHLFSEDQPAAIPGFSLKRLQQTSLLTANLCKAFVQEPKRAREAYTLGLLHDVGQVVLALGVREEYARILHTARKERRPIHALEHELLGVTHAEVGAYLLGIWGLPLETLEVVCHHHEPSRLAEGPFDLLGALHVADVLVDAVTGMLSGRGRGPDAVLDEAFLVRSGLVRELPRWRKLAEKVCAEAG
jgi:HD-like signal output (HDOD) protein